MLNTDKITHFKIATAISFKKEKYPAKQILDAPPNLEM